MQPEQGFRAFADPDSASQIAEERGEVANDGFKTFLTFTQNISIKKL